MEDWFRWIVSIFLGAYGAVTSWIVHTMLGENKQLAAMIASLDKRLALEEARVQVDPILYTQAITQMAAAIGTMSDKITAGIADRQTLFANMTRLQESLEEQLDILRQQLNTISSTLTLENLDVRSQSSQRSI